MGTQILIGVGVAVWLAGAVFSVRVARKMRAKRRAAGEEVPKANPLLAVAILVVILFAFGVVLGPGILAEQRDEELRETGTPATAEVLAVEETGNVYNRRPEVAVTVRVEPEGGDAFESQSTWIFSVSDIQAYRPGTTVDVFFDPADHETVAIVGPTKAAQAPGE
jgi:hypothetical protein